MNRRKKVVVLGAGVTGLASAYRLSRNPEYEVHVVEKEAAVGGLCQSFTDGDFILDYGPHKFYTLLDGVVEELKSIMGDDLLEREKTQTLFMGGKYFQFPLKMSELLTRFPPLKSSQFLVSFAYQLFKNQWDKKEAKTYEDFLVERFGRAIYGQVFEPMAKKMFGMPQELDRKLAEVRVSAPGLFAILKQLLLKTSVDRTVNAPSFHYPRLGYGMIPDRLKEKAEQNGAQFYLGSKVVKINVQAGKIGSITLETRSGETLNIPCDHLIYTIPLSMLDRLIPVGLPEDIRRAARQVDYRHSIVYYFLLRSQPVLPSLWTFFPESKFRFGRLSEMAKFSPFTAPPGHTALMVDFTCLENDPVWSMDDKAMGELLYDQMKCLKLFEKNQIVKSFSKRFRNFYPIYNVGYQNNIQSIRRLETQFNNLFFIGRLGDFNYNNADQCLDMGFRAADHIIHSGGVRSGWHEVREKNFETYRIVD